VNPSFEKNGSSFRRCAFRLFVLEIPYQVRDDNVWLLRKRPIPSFRQSSWSESRYYCFTALLDERITVRRLPSFTLLFPTPYPLSPTPVSRKPRSRIKSGMTVFCDCDNVRSCHAELVSASCSLFSKNFSMDIDFPVLAATDHHRPLTSVSPPSSHIYLTNTPYKGPADTRSILILTG